MAEPRRGFNQIFDFRAALIASIAAVLAFWLTMMVLDARTLNSPWFTVHSAASVVSGAVALENTAVFNFATVATGVGVYLVVGLVLGLIISGLLHEFGLIVGVIGGAVLGFSTYVLLYYVATRYGLLQDIGTLARWPLEVGHTVFGAVAGGVYEALERARYEKG